MRKLSVLVVDDTSTMREYIRFGLRDNFPGINIEEACTGKEAIAKLDQTEYDLVLCDWELPDINGDEVLHWVRTHPMLHQVPFVIISSRNDKETIIKAIHGGVDSYIVKPFTVGSLVQKITITLNGFDRRRFQRFNISGTIDLQVGERTINGDIIDISLGGVFIVASRNNLLPTVFEKVAVDVNLEAGKISGIEGFVIRIQAAEALSTAKNVKIAIKFTEVGQRIQKLQTLINFIKE